MGRKGFGCSQYTTGCKFVIWKESYGRSLTDNMVKTLIEKGKTSKIKLKNKEGTPYDARIVLKDPNTGALDLEFVE